MYFPESGEVLPSRSRLSQAHPVLVRVFMFSRFFLSGHAPPRAAPVFAVTTRSTEVFRFSVPSSPGLQFVFFKLFFTGQ